MRATEPKVRLIQSPRVHWGQVHDYLQEIGGLEWFNRVRPTVDDTLHHGVSDSELLVEYAGRRCYRSWAPGLNANVTKVREDSGEYIRNILSSKHGAVLEHAQLTFDFDQVSRVFTHELVRHRAGVAISQESLRYVRLTDLGFRIPEILDRPDLELGTPTTEGHRATLPDAIVSIIERLEEFQKNAAEAFGLDDEGVPFHLKKEVTSALRRLAPLGLSTGMVWSANFRTLRHVIDQRTAPFAEEEIRLVFHQVARICKREFPLMFADFTPHAVDEDSALPPHWQPDYEKV